MKIQLLALAMFFSAAVAYAGPSVSGGVGISSAMTCTSSDGTYTLKIGTNIGTIWTGYLQIGNNRPIEMRCPEKVGNPSAWACAETRNGEGRYGIYLVETANGPQGNLLHEQMYPLQPKKVANMSCQFADNDPNQRN